MSLEVIPDNLASNALEEFYVQNSGYNIPADL